ncbi:MAG: amidase family protein, partial [Gammaproteobacteria bacterium]|nr:amidase family protein [Gammaproteobacteria bacterium]
MHSKTIAELAEGLKNGDFSSEELTKNYLQRIKQFDPELNSFITVSEDHALNQARAADKLIAAGNASVLTGIPFAQKDIFCTNGIK